MAGGVEGSGDSGGDAYAESGCEPPRTTCERNGEEPPAPEGCVPGPVADPVAALVANAISHVGQNFQPALTGAPHPGHAGCTSRPQYGPASQPASSVSPQSGFAHRVIASSFEWGSTAASRFALPGEARAYCGTLPPHNQGGPGRGQRVGSALAGRIVELPTASGRGGLTAAGGSALHPDRTGVRGWTGLERPLRAAVPARTPAPECSQAEPRCCCSGSSGRCCCDTRNGRCSHCCSTNHPEPHDSTLLSVPEAPARSSEPERMRPCGFGRLEPQRRKNVIEEAPVPAGIGVAQPCGQRAADPLLRQTAVRDGHGVLAHPAPESLEVRPEDAVRRVSGNSWSRIGGHLTFIAARNRTNTLMP